MSESGQSDFPARMQEIEKLIGELENVADSRARTASSALVRALLEIHAGGLKKLLDLAAAAGESGKRILESCQEDDLLRNLLLLHGLHPLDLETRIQQALARVRPFLNSHGGDVELLAIAPNAVRLKLKGSCHGCAGSLATLKSRIEEAICELAPDVETIDVEGVAAISPVPPPKSLTLPILNVLPILSGAPTSRKF